MISSPNEHSKWPISAILGFGTFGTGTPAGQRYHRRATVALLALVGWMILLRCLVHPILLLVLALVPGLVFLYLVYEFRRYLLTLDELARRMQMEALAWTYLTGLAIAMFVGGLGMMAGWRVNPMWFILLEPVRATFLYVASRRY